MASQHESRRVRTTVRLPRTLYDRAKKYVDREVVAADNVNDFFVAAINAYVKLLERKEIDARFAAMGEDTAYQKEAKLIAEEFSASDWEALGIAEKHLREA
jgi:hypothetical protein